MSIEACAKCGYQQIDTDFIDPYIAGVPYCGGCAAEIEDNETDPAPRFTLDAAGFRSSIDGWFAEIARLKATAPKFAPRQMTDIEFDYATERQEGWALEQPSNT